MAALTFTLTQAVKQVCEKMGDDEYTRWSDITNYAGRACKVLVEVLNELIDLYSDFVKQSQLGGTVDPVKTNELDFHGLIGRAEIAIGVTGKVTLTTAIENVKHTLDIYTDPDGTNFLEKPLQRIPESFMSGGADQLFGPVDVVKWYTVGSLLVFQPISVFATGTHNVYIKYIKFCFLNTDGGDKDTDILTLFTKNLVDMAINITFKKLEQEEIRRGK